MKIFDKVFINPWNTLNSTHLIPFISCLHCFLSVKQTSKKVRISEYKEVEEQESEI